MTAPNRPTRLDPSRQPAPRPAALRRALPLLVAAAFAALALALASCGSSATSYITPSPTPRSDGTPSSTASAGPTATPGAAAYAYLYSQIDYPLQVPLNGSDSVTLTLSPKSSILTVTPGPGRGSGTISQPILLPTDLQDYRDIAASVDTQAADTGPLTWALQSPIRQSLLTSSNPDDRHYKSEVTFTWAVRATSAGTNTVKVVLHLTYVYLDGSEHDGTIEVSQAPIPIVAVQETVANTALPQLKLPIAGLSGLAGVIALLRFIYTALKTISDVTEPVKDAAKVANAVRGRVGALQQSAGQPQSPPPLPRYGPQWQPGAGGQPPAPPAPGEHTQAQSRPSRRPWPPMAGR
jgi:hypothetical protein